MKRLQVKFWLRVILGIFCVVACLYFSPFFLKKPRRIVPLLTSLSQALTQEPILETRKLTLSQYPNAYNPSLIPWKEGYLLSFRYRKKNRAKKLDRLRPDHSYIGLVKLDQNFNILEETAQLLDTRTESDTLSQFAEDARLLRVDDRIILVFNDLQPGLIHGTCAMYLGELIENNSKFELKAPAVHLKYAHAIKFEKNWTPFTSQGKLYLVYYADQPRIILEVDEKTGECKEVDSSETSLGWNWGKVRGGTPAYPVKDQFITFFHSVVSSPCFNNKAEKSGLNYVMGIYTFDSTPPFSLRQLLPLPLGELEIYQENNHRKFVFPGGAHIEEDKIHMVWGKNDKEIYLTTYDKERLFKLMVPVSQPKK